jgi:hypothetical protein
MRGVQLQWDIITFVNVMIYVYALTVILDMDNCNDLHQQCSETEKFLLTCILDEKKLYTQ